MTSTLKLLAPFTLLAFLGTVNLHAQTQTPQVPTTQTAKTQAPKAALVPPVKLSAAEQQFDETVRAFEAYLFGSGAFVVDVTSNWTYTGAGKTTRGTNLFRLAVVKGGKYRIEAGSKKKGKAQYICVSDGEKITRVLHSAKYYSQQEVSADREDLLRDTLTLQTLAGSGVELLIQPQIRAQLISQISEVRIVGDETMENQPVTHMQLMLLSKRQIDLWFTKAKNPMLLQLVSTQQVPITGKETIQLVTTSKFQWKVGGPLPESTFSVSIPPNTRRVDDLMAALRDGDIRQLLGKRAPALQLNDTANKPVQLADYLGKKVVVLIFWASWCAPSTHGMDTLNEYVQQTEKNGAVVFAINFGETLAEIEASLKTHPFQGKILLDPKNKGLEAFRFGELPTTILIGKDGTIQSFYSGSTDAVRKHIREDTAALLQGKQLVPNK